MPSFVNEIGTVGYVHIPKSGGSYFCNVLESYGAHMNYFHKCGSGLQDAHLPAHCILKIHPSCSMITHVRNPYDRFVSMFCMGRVLGLHTFEVNKQGLIAFCETSNLQSNVMYKPMTFFTHTDDRLVCLVDHWFRYESFDDNIQPSVRMFGVTPSHLDKEAPINENMYIQRTMYGTLYNNDTVIDYVNRHYRDDFLNFGYDMF
jgi:hypothetical protein